MSKKVEKAPPWLSAIQKVLYSKGQWLLKQQKRLLVTEQNLQLTVFCWKDAYVESFYLGKTGEGSTPFWPTQMCLHQICEGCYCVQNLIQCRILLMPIFCSTSSKYSNHVIYFLLVNWSNFLSHLNSCPGDLPNNDSCEWNESCLSDSCGTSN